MQFQQVHTCLDLELAFTFKVAIGWWSIAFIDLIFLLLTKKIFVLIKCCHSPCYVFAYLDKLEINVFEINDHIKQKQFDW